MEHANLREMETTINSEIKNMILVFEVLPTFLSIGLVLTKEIYVEQFTPSRMLCEASVQVIYL